ncbi:MULTISPECIES: hypothetical protein [unclassified Mesorhizobium]|uniref:DUF3592 domain-containing protein n=1 Tax=unclassified Mesorhizobium TaxID=325217 RepID=UPI0003D0091A|nr:MULTISPECIES: hypothetical protein [unclassified Mesorhizobium]ESZ02356.1 hypothetical protein X737_38395 [Mesorhizobium sp. L48C026A00]RWN51537.1 MAG: hypothetical protein EOS00_34130 [Mesorhizobium sp.]RWN51945.1 MAG: hypothetical protein EOR98_24150 [Mesorhizobium sp.]RWN73046.1 MAG: hypothetical protein EOS02_25450 [Mesorhizobium sp.]RWN76228.1 MAG: hypothetical protein EOS01_21165 [Mesorhizobium sp.]
MSDFAAFLVAFLLCGGAFFAVAFLHSIWLRDHTKDWVPAAAEVLKRIDGGEGPDRYLLQYVFDGKDYRIETSPSLVPTCPAEAGSRITILVNPDIPHQCASAPHKPR